MVTIRVRCRPCGPDRQETVCPQPGGSGIERHSERIHHTSIEYVTSLHRERHEKDWSALSKAESTRIRRKGERGDSLHKYRNHGDADRPADRPDFSGDGDSSYPAAAFGQEHTLISPPVGRDDEHTVGLPAPLRIGTRWWRETSGSGFSGLSSLSGLSGLSGFSSLLVNLVQPSKRDRPNRQDRPDRLLIETNQTNQKVHRVRPLSCGG